MSKLWLLPDLAHASRFASAFPWRLEHVSVSEREDVLGFSSVSAECAACGLAASPESAGPVHYWARFENGPEVGFAGWIHDACLDRCDATEEEAPTPW